MPNLTTEKFIEKAKNIHGVKYDYSLVNYKQAKYKLCIELDGKQHFEEIKHFGGKNKFNEQKIRDEIKNIYCKENNIYLLRIKYNEDIENKLKEFNII
jgi:very-short-patch-repair endonuclease